MSKQLIRIALLVILAVGQGWTQNVHFEPLSIKQGLSLATVTCVLQDRRGFLWFGTADGLNRYDGYSFKTYRSDPADTSGLSSSLINVLYEDWQGNFWMGGIGGTLHQFDRRTGRVTRLENQAASPNAEDGEDTLQRTGLIQRPDGYLPGRWVFISCHQAENPLCMAAGMV
jgi:ligand-binding sensor domain-containing protein